MMEFLELFSRLLLLFINGLVTIHNLQYSKVLIYWTWLGITTIWSTSLISMNMTQRARLKYKNKHTSRGCCVWKRVGKKWIFPVLIHTHLQVIIRLGWIYAVGEKQAKEWELWITGLLKLPGFKFFRLAIYTYLCIFMYRFV